jgi:hypothetical protein
MVTHAMSYDIFFEGIILYNPSRVTIYFWKEIANY